MIAHLEDRAAALIARGWTRREAEWLALVCLVAVGNRVAPVPPLRSVRAR